jgi:peptidoglycan/xylan/chitin deacetylase (PgdA/CDA1 family)
VSDRRPRTASSVLAPLVFVLGVVVLAVVVSGWQSAHRRARRAPRRFPGAQSVLWRASRLAAPTLGAPVRVAVLRDPASARYYDAPGAMDSIVGTWVAALHAIGATTRVISPAEALRVPDEQVLIVPASPCLGRDARHAIEVATERGTGVLMTWLSGVRDGGCRARGYGLVMQVSGAWRLDTLATSRDECYVTFLRGGPLAADIPPGARLELTVSNHVALRTPDREAYFSDFMLNPRDVRGEPLLDGAIVATRIGRARAVYWGYDLRAVADRPWDRALALLVTRNSVAWAAGIPLSTTEPWPDGKRSAAVFAEDVEDEFANARYALDSLRAAHVPGTYFVVSRLAEHNADLAQALAAQGEVGTHTPRHQLLGGRSAAEQRADLDESQRELTALLGHPVAGLRPPEEQFDETTLDAWRLAGGRYMFAALNGRAASPEILVTKDGPLVALGRVTNDDFIEVARRRRVNVDSLAGDFLAGYEKVRALGGLFILSYHSQMLSRPELVPALARVARVAARDTSVWLATAGEVADWWMARSLVTTRARALSPARLAVEVRNQGATVVRGLVVRVAATGSTPRAADNGAHMLPSDSGAIRVLVPPIQPGGVYQTTIVLDAPEARIGGGAHAR